MNPKLQNVHQSEWVGGAMVPRQDKCLGCEQAASGSCFSRLRSQVTPPKFKTCYVKANPALKKEELN